MASMDERLLFALRYLRNGELVYGVQGKHSGCLEDYARDLGYNEKYGNLMECNPIPCDLVHEGYSQSCEAHALYCALFTKVTLDGDGGEHSGQLWWYFVLKLS